MADEDATGERNLRASPFPLAVREGGSRESENTSSAGNGSKADPDATSPPSRNGSSSSAFAPPMRLLDSPFKEDAPKLSDVIAMAGSGEGSVEGDAAALVDADAEGSSMATWGSVSAASDSVPPAWSVKGDGDADVSFPC